MGNFLKTKTSEYLDAIMGNAIYDLLKIILKILFGDCIIGLLSNIVINFVNIAFLEEYKNWFIIIVIILTSLAILEFYTRKHKKIPIIPSIDSNYNIIKREVSFTYGQDKSDYKLYLQVKSNVKNLNRIHGKYTWSGSGTPNIYCATKHCNLIPLTRKDSYIEYEVELRKNYRKGKKAECTIIGEMPDPNHTFVPFFSTQIQEVTELLVINICIPPKYNVREIVCEEIPVVRNNNENSEIVLLDEEGKYTWKIPSPNLLYKYSIRWDLN